MKKLVKVLFVSPWNWFQKIFKSILQGQYIIYVRVPQGKPERMLGKSFQASFHQLSRVKGSSHWRIKEIIDGGSEVYLLSLYPSREGWTLYKVRASDGSIYGLYIHPEDSPNGIAVGLYAKKIPWWKLRTRLAVWRASFFIML